jgi:hypothetical protein
MSYTKERVLYDTIALNYPAIKVILESLKFDDDKVKTSGTAKFRVLTPNVATYCVKWNEELKKYDWADAVNKVFEIRFITTEIGLYAIMPHAIRKQQNEKGEWVPMKDAYDRIQRRKTFNILGLNGANRLQTLRVMIEAAIEAKAGRFKYHVGTDDDYFYAFRRLGPDEEQTESGFIGVKKDKIESLRAQGFNVQTRTSIKSCTNCSNCYYLQQDDAGYGVPTVPVSELVANGPCSPRRMCMVHKEMLDVEACDKVNHMSLEEPELYSQNGYRIPVRYDEVVIESFQYGERKNLVKSWLEESEEEDEDAEPQREYEIEEYEGSFSTKISHNDLIGLMLQDRAENCPMWTRVDSKHGYYENAKVDKAAVFGLKDGCWEYLDNNKAIRKAGKNWKVQIRYQGLELTYNKPTPLERQWAFLDEFDNWIVKDINLENDLEMIEKSLKMFEKETPDPSIRDRWLLAANTFVKEVWPLTADETLPKSRLEALLGKLLTL